MAMVQQFPVHPSHRAELLFSFERPLTTWSSDPPSHPPPSPPDFFFATTHHLQSDLNLRVAYEAWQCHKATILSTRLPPESERDFFSASLSRLLTAKEASERRGDEWTIYTRQSKRDFMLR